MTGFYARIGRKKGGQKAVATASVKLLKVADWVLIEWRPCSSYGVRPRPEL